MRFRVKMNTQETLCLVLLCVSVVAASSGATAFDEIRGVGGCMKASWRLQVTFLVQVPLAINSLRLDFKSCWWALKGYWCRILISGVCYSVHFCTWANSLVLTSMAHSLLFVTSVPLILLVWYFISCQEVKKSELAGVALGFVGLSVTVLGTSSGEAGVLGDLLAFSAALAMAVHLSISGKVFEKIFSFWIYVVPMNFIGSLLSFFFAVAVESESPFKFAEWVYTQNARYVLYLGIVPGVLGHAMFNYLLKYITPVLVTVFLNFEPAIGSTIGWVAGFQSPPNAYTWLGGAVVLCGNTLVTLTGFKAKEPQECSLQLEDYKVSSQTLNS